MSMRRVRTETGVYPKTDAVTKLSLDFRNRFLRRVMREAAFFLLSRHRKQKEVRNTGSQVLLDHLQSRRNVVAHVAAQSGNRLFLRKAFDHEEWLNQLRAIEFSFRAQVAQVWRRTQAHQTLHWDISSSHCS